MTQSEEMSIYLYQNFKIAEWEEKCNVLTYEEQRQVLIDLESKRETDLVKLVCLPFPIFVQEYFKDFPGYQKYFSDPSCGFKLFLLPPSKLRCMAERIRNPKNLRTEIQRYGYSYRTSLFVPYIFMMSIDEIINLENSNTKRKNAEKKFAYLTQYIDYETAKELGLKIADTFFHDSVDGYGLYEKLEILPPSLRQMMIEYIGLYGYQRKTATQLLEKYKFTDKKDSQKNALLVGCDPWSTINAVFHYFLRPYGELKNFLGYREDMQTEGNMPEYLKSNIRDMMIGFEAKYIFYNLSDSALAVLSQKTPRERVLYLAAKYMYKTPESLARNLVITPVQAKKFLLEMSDEKKI